MQLRNNSIRILKRDSGKRNEKKLIKLYINYI